MITHEHFLNVILQEPEHDLHRLVYADWLEEQGDPRGELLRLMVEMAEVDVKSMGLAAGARKMREKRIRQIAPLLEQLQDSDWLLFITTLGQKPLPERFGIAAQAFPLREPLTRRGRLMTLRSQWRKPLTAELWEDLRVLNQWDFSDLEPMTRPELFLAELSEDTGQLTGEQVLAALQAKGLRTDFPDLLHQTGIPRQVYGTLLTYPSSPLVPQEMIHSDASRPETDLARLLLPYVREERLWFVRFRPRPYTRGGALSFSVGISLASGQLIGMISWRQGRHLP